MGKNGMTPATTNAGQERSAPKLAITGERELHVKVAADDQLKCHAKAKSTGEQCACPAVRGCGRFD